MTKTKKIGTGIFTFKENCADCGQLTKVDINGFCKDCYIEDIEKEIRKKPNKKNGVCPVCEYQVCRCSKSIKVNMKTIKLYHHKTDGGAEYLTDKFIICPNGSKEGIFKNAKFIIRIDGDITKDAELSYKEIK